MSAIIKCEDVSIRYITGDFKDIGLKEYFVRRLTGNYEVTEFWADRHVTFELQHGDMLGIIGSNGAGKSTLLKAISGIMVPTEGSVECTGKISALLELGSGFDGDLTVRENTYLRAAMLGYSRSFVDATYDSIIDFAELRGFEERPFKQLSSGMKSRLAFSIASLVDPEILILDEVLSVGDGAFRKKSEDKMRQIIGGGATTILVSHAVEQVRSLCNKVLWLDHGNQIAFGTNVKGLCDAYQSYLDTRKMPAELPAFDLPGVSSAAAAGDAPDVDRVLADASPAAGIAAHGEGAPATGTAPAAGAGRLRRLVRKPPKGVVLALVALAMLTAAIAVSEARLPAEVRALPQSDANVLYTDAGSGTQVCLWDNKLYVFMDRAHAQDSELYVEATDSHGYVTSDTYAVAAQANARFGTDDTAVLMVNLGRYKGYVQVRYGEVDREAAPKADGAPSLVWESVYQKGAPASIRG